MTWPTVRVWEAPGVADALAEASDLAVDASPGPPPWEEAPDCVVTAPTEEAVSTVREAYPEGPLVTVGDADEERVATLLADGATEHVQGGDAQAPVLARRIERITEREPATAGTPERYARLLETLDAGVYVLDPAGICTFVNDEVCALTGYPEDELLGAGPRLVVNDVTADAIDRAIVDRLKETTESVTVQRRITIQRKDDSTVHCNVHVTLLRDAAGEVLGIVGLLRDVSERERRQDLLASLQETSQSLMQAPTRETVAGIVADAAVETLGFDHCTVRLYDADDRTLEPVAVREGDVPMTAERPVYGLDDGPPAEVFTTGEPVIYDDVRSIDDGHDRSPIRGAMYVPIGVHGTLSLGATTPGAFDDADRQIGELLATNAAAACNRAKREREVRDAREHVTAIVDRINGLVEDTIEVLVGATTRAELESRVCAQLAATEPYVHAWLARADVREETLRPAEGAGDDHPAITDASIPVDGDSPGAVAYREGRSQVVDTEPLDAAGDNWLAAAREAGVESVVAIPLSHRRASYGVLFVCARRTDAFDERERVVLEALGRAVANAIDAIESGRILETDEVIELSIAVEDGTVLGRVSAAAGATLASAGTMTDDDARLRLFLTATGAPAEEVRAALEGDDAVTGVTLVADLEEALFDVALSDSLVADLVDRGALPRRVTAENGISRLTLEVTDERAARETFGFVERRHDAVTLVGYHEHERPVRTRQEFRASLAERFTDRQETALRTAYHGGFFDWPRGADGDELAAGMDISRPTYHQHLRAAQRKVFEELFGAETTLAE